MDVESLKKKINNIIDDWADQYQPSGSSEATKQAIRRDEAASDVVVDVLKDRKLPEGKRVVRTKSSGDRVYMLDDEKKARHWITNPEVLKGLGFELSDVTEVDDMEMLKYQLGSALYRVDA